MNASMKTVVKTVRHPVVLALLAAVILYVCYVAFKKIFKKGGSKLPEIMQPIYIPGDNKPTQLPACPSCAKPTQLPACPDCAKPTQLPWIPDDI
ncbi:hypothetical protein MT325_M121R [Paramecium bursaria chlorella virus MT325]|uniref:Uncharacterized protein M121R n=1 Tax=Paramecium bursaria Chlorella virus MT325 TaxID=346932 RepID=A7ITK1_PBCVM|nr:hypothetical protein MT325_M121R [Paramecium bursaria chlorella virus MT325]